MKPADDCDLCPLCAERINIVRPSGDLNSGIAFVGEAPGESEDQQGKPFIGRSGKILDKIMEEEGLERSKVMITNTVKCRPPKNRDPTKDEMAACSLVIGLGKSACRDLLGYDGKMGDIVNKRVTITVDGKSIPFIPTYHPAACIYNKDARVGLRETIRTVRDELGPRN
jgi:DNA polymerase